MKPFESFSSVFSQIDDGFRFGGQLVHTERWQANEIKDKPEAQMVEILHHSFAVSLPHCVTWLDDIKPNLPWAENHFRERICGYPINPGVEWENWPWADSADKHRESDGMFNHNYMERYWPKYAGKVDVPTGNLKHFRHELNHVTPNDFHAEPIKPNKGIRHEYGGLADLISLLANEPGTRQAYLPVWFPEDTGNIHNGRKPCTLGYHFIMRNGRLDVTYYIRSCDYFRHFRDDIYLTIRLLHHILEQCRERNPKVWNRVYCGTFNMHITSLHMFINDYVKLYGRQPNG